MSGPIGDDPKDPVDLIDEEPWEAEIGALLAGLPMVEPPAGFIERAVDHRPLHAGRSLAALSGLAAAAIIVALLSGVAGHDTVVPPIDELVARHNSAVAGLSVDPIDHADRVPSDIAGSGPSDIADRAPSDIADRAPSDIADRAPSDIVGLPPGFRPAATVAAEDIRQAVYARGDESVSVFVQEGMVAWSFLAADGLTELAGLPAWVDGDRNVAVLEAEGRTITIVGLPPGELDRALERLPAAEPSLGSKARDLAEAVLVQLGYAPVNRG